MAYRHWSMGLHIKKDDMVCIALQKNRHGWSLRRWWQQEIAPDMTTEQRIALLRQWRREVPFQHTVAVAIPAADTLQKKLPAPHLVLRESEQAQWIVSTVARQIEMEPQLLTFDYHDAGEHYFNVTAARRQDVEHLRHLTKAAGLKIGAITPDACALQNYLPWLAGEYDGLCWFDGQQWLWATRSSWGYSPNPANNLLRCGDQNASSEPFYPWNSLRQIQPPLPENRDGFTIALALALGGHQDASIS